MPSWASLSGWADGRDPHGSDAAQSGLRAVRIDDHSGQMSRAHAELHIVDGKVFIADRNSTNGVFVREQAQLRWSRLTPWEPVVWYPGAYVQIGGRILRLHETTADALQRGPRVSVPHGVPGHPHGHGADVGR